MNERNFIPAEWEVQKALWCGWPSRPDLWEGNLLAEARAEIAAMINPIAESQRVNIVAYGDEAVSSARKLLTAKAHVHDLPLGDIWLRDIGPIYTGKTALRFQHNGWGGEFIYEHDDTVGDKMAEISDKPVTRFDFVLEGGALEHNGKGAVLTTRQCVLNANRNKWTQDIADEQLKHALGAHSIYWLDDGLLNDHTDGHIDNLARFIAADTVLCQSAYGDDDPNTALYTKTAHDLAEMGFKVVQIPSPGLVKDSSNHIVPASHMNFIIANDFVMVPTYGTKSADHAIGMIAEHFPTRKVIGLRSNAILTGGGSFHCITQQEPA